MNATGVWVELEDVRHDRTDSVWEDGPQGLFNNTPPFGLIPRDEGPAGDEIVTGIGFRFLASPAGIHDQPIAAIDVSRQVQWRGWELAVPGGEWILVKSVEFPYRAELPNDDAGNADETTIDTSDRIYSRDYPGLAPVNDADAEAAFAANFLEFVRVSFDGIRPTGNTIKGSRGSPLADWHTRLYVVKVDGKLQRPGPEGDMTETESNDIGEGHYTSSATGIVIQCSSTDAAQLCCLHLPGCATP